MPVHVPPQALPSLGALHISGADALAYLQGQLSAELRPLQAGQLAWAGLHTPQGRVLALLALAPLAPAGDWLAVLPAALAESAAAALRRFVLRARVSISVSPPGAVCLPGEAAVAGTSPEGTSPEGTSPEGTHALRHPDGARLLWLPAGGARDADEAAQAGWERNQVRLGLPQVHPETSGMFVAQMLNLDCIGAIAFDKGCYTGQEVVARAHYRGRVKRRMQRFASATLPAAPGGGELRPGSALRLADGRTAQLVRSAAQADGSVEWLAVCAWPAAGQAQGSGANPAPVEPAGDTANANANDNVPDAARAVDSRALPLPYPLPE
jgi:folate-binding protein YgfZ